MNHYTPAHHLFHELEEIYADLDRRTAAFARQVNLSCPKGCGTCCENFEPDITDIEATYVAVHLIIEAPALIDRLTAVALQQACVFYEPEGAYHCSIYDARPLICRAFGFSASSQKNGLSHFAGCRHMPGAKDRAADLREPEHRPPVMAEYGVRISALSTGNRSAMRAEVLRAVGSLGLKMKLAASLTTVTPSPDSGRPPAGKERKSGAA
ncbi:MAG: YkgJ family cysteine cluster protein [Spirochaetales bacterium]|nr:YkgJ family cysteine cluster protein [Spirochaetales bacterium]